MEPSLAIEQLKSRTFFAKNALSESEIAFDLGTLLERFEVINRAVNGEVPSLSVRRENASLLMDAGYWVSCIVADGQMTLLRLCEAETPDIRSAADRLTAALFVASHAWSQVYAGDIDDLREDAALALEIGRLA